MTGTLWEPTTGKLVFLFALAVFALAVGLFVLIRRRRLTSFVRTTLAIPDTNALPDIAAVFGGSLFVVAGIVVGGFAVLIAILGSFSAS